MLLFFVFLLIDGTQKRDLFLFFVLKCDYCTAFSCPQKQYYQSYVEIWSYVFVSSCRRSDGCTTFRPFSCSEKQSVIKIVDRWDPIFCFFCKISDIFMAVPQSAVRKKQNGIQFVNRWIRLGPTLLFFVQEISCPYRIQLRK